MFDRVQTTKTAEHNLLLQSCLPPLIYQVCILMQSNSWVGRESIQPHVRVGLEPATFWLHLATLPSTYHLEYNTFTTPHLHKMKTLLGSKRAGDHGKFSVSPVQRIDKAGLSFLKFYSLYKNMQLKFSCLVILSFFILSHLCDRTRFNFFFVLTWYLTKW